MNILAFCLYKHEGSQTELLRERFPCDSLDDVNR